MFNGKCIKGKHASCWTKQKEHRFLQSSQTLILKFLLLFHCSVGLCCLALFTCYLQNIVNWSCLHTMSRDCCIGRHFEKISRAWLRKFCNFSLLPLVFNYDKPAQSCLYSEFSAASRKFATGLKFDVILN